MIAVSSAWQAALNGGASYTTRAVIALADNTTFTVNAEDICIRGNRFTDGAGASSFPVGAAMSRTMQLNLDNGDERYADVDFFGAVIRLYLVRGEEDITIGKFTVRTPETYGETVLITAQDDMYKADRSFSTSLTYPAAAQALWTEICASCGIPDGMSGGIPLGAYSIASAPFGDLTYRQVLGYIAMLSGGNARINRLGNLEIVNYDFAALDRLAGFRESGGRVEISYPGVSATETDGDIVLTFTGLVATDDGEGNITITVSDAGDWDAHDLTMWRSLRVDTEDVTITGVQTTVYDGEESTALLVGTDDYALTLTNPLFAGQENAALTTIYNALAGHPFRGFSGEYIAYPLAEFGDLCRITDRKGRICYSIITDVDFTWSAATVLSNSAESPLRAGSVYAKETVSTLQRAAQMVAAEATARANAITALQNALAAAGGLYETTQSDGSGGTIYLFHDKPTLAGSDIVIRITAEAVGISTDGGATYATGFNFATSTAIINILQAVGIDADWINAGALTIRDANNNVIFSADKDSKTVLIGGWTATATSISFTEEGTQEVYSLGRSGAFFGEFARIINAGLAEFRAIGVGIPNPSLSTILSDFPTQIGGSYIIVDGRDILSDIGILSHLTTTAQNSLVDAVNEVNTVKGWTMTSNVTTVGLTVTMWRNDLLPELVKLRIRGTTTALLGTGGGYANIWQVSDLANYLTADIISREFLTADYSGQVRINTTGQIQLGYTREMAGNTAADLPSGSSLYFEKLFLLT